MKKFFSLVLALVMALSLTTVAWGVDVDNTNAQSTLHAAGEDLVLNLTGDITSKLVVDWRTTDEGYTTPTQPSGVGYLVYPMKRTMGDLTIQGSGTTKFAGLTFISGLTNYDGVSGAGGDHVTADACYIIDTLTFAKVKITEKVDLATGGAGRAVINELVFDHVTFDVASDICAYIGSGFVKNVTFKYCTFNDVSKAAIEVTGAASDINVTVDNCEFNGPARGILLSSDGYTGDISVTNNKFAVTDRAIRITDLGAGASLEIQDNKVTALGSDNEAMKLDSIDSTATIENWNNTYPAGAKLLVGSAESAALADIGSGVTTDANGNITGGVFTTVPSSVAAGYTVATDVNGNIVVLAGTNVPASGAKGAYYTTDMATLAVYPACDLNSYKYTLESYANGSSVAKLFDQKAIWATHKVTGAKVLVDTAVVASADSANLAFVNGASVTYLNTNVNQWTAKATAVGTVDVDDAEKCGDVFATGDVGVYTDANGVVYVEDASGVAFNVNGELVLLKAANEVEVTVAGLKTLVPAADTVYTVKHTYAAETKTAAGKTEITKVACSECKKSFAFVEGTTAQAIAKFGAGNYVTETLAGKTVYIAVSGTSVGTSAGVSTDKVTSAETFDAGIAMYVGMSVMAAAGSAVVLKKKKD